MSELELCYLDTLERWEEESVGVDDVMFAYTQDVNGLLAEIKRLKAQLQWIPVNERLPEDHQRCITLHKLQGHVEILGFRAHENIKTGDRVIKNTFVMVDTYGYEKSVSITHWMPLPQLQQEGE